MHIYADIVSSMIQNRAQGALNLKIPGPLPTRYPLRKQILSRQDKILIEILGTTVYIKGSRILGFATHQSRKDLGSLAWNRNATIVF
jgi:hypothetical protein